MSEPPSKRARLSESPRAERTGSPGDRFAGSSSSRPRPSVLASPKIRQGSDARPFHSPSLSPNPSHHSMPAYLTLPQPTSSSGFSGGRPPGSAGSSRVPLPSIGQVSGGWGPQTSGWDPGPGPPSRGMGESAAVFGRNESLGMITESHEGSDAGTVGSRDPGRERAPRSMMACVRCRKQKMKCDGPAAAPCRGCKSVNTTCIFETRTRSSRPKSMSILAAQPLPAVMSSITGTPVNTASSSSSLHQSAYGHKSSRSLEPHSMAPMMGPSGPESPRTRHAMPPPPGLAKAATITERGGSISYAVPPHGGVPPQPGGPYALQAHPRSTHRPSFSTSTLDISRPPALTGYAGPSGSSGTGAGLVSPITSRPMTAAAPAPQNVYAMEHRIRNLENAARSAEALQASQVAMQNTVHYLELQVRHLTGQVTQMTESGVTKLLQREKGKQREVYISERTWDAYRSYISPLSPWLVTLADPTNLSGEIIAALGIRPRINTAQAEALTQAREMVRIELARLIASGDDWTRDDVHALGTFAMWEGSSSLASLVIGQARTSASRRNGGLGREMAEARDTVEMVLLEHMLWSMQSPCYVPASVRSSVSSTWRDRVKTHTPVVPSEKDNDVKMLAWIEYAEMLTDAQNMLLDVDLNRLKSVSPSGGESSESPPVERRAATERVKEERIGKRRGLLSSWDAWQSRWGQGGDPILALHYHFAILLSTSPLLMRETTEAGSPTSPVKTAVGGSPPTRSRDAPGSAGGSSTTRGTGTAGGGASSSSRFGLWEELSADHGGYEILTRARDSAVSLIRSICSPEIARTLHYSLPIFRSRLAFAISHLLAHSVALPHSTLTAMPLHQSTLRLAYERLGGRTTPDRGSPVWSALGEHSALVEVVQTGDLTLGSTRALFGDVAEGSIEVGPALWDRVLGR